MIYVMGLTNRPMIRIRFIQLLDDKGFREGRRISLAEVAKETGISRPTITRIINTAGYNLGLDGVDALCRYLECQPGDLLEYVDKS